MTERGAEKEGEERLKDTVDRSEIYERRSQLERFEIWGNTLHMR